MICEGALETRELQLWNSNYTGWECKKRHKIAKRMVYRNKLPITTNALVVRECEEYEIVDETRNSRRQTRRHNDAQCSYLGKRTIEGWNPI